MKLQYLGDSKDSFKWDYHHFLMDALGYGKLLIAWMMTPDDGGKHGNTAPERFPARPEIVDMCHRLRATRDPTLLIGLPAMLGARYAVEFHDADKTTADREQRAFFSGIEADPDHVVFLDPDNGFEPERSATDGHVRYADLDRLIKAIPPGAVVTVFQHHRRKKFPEDFARIRERLVRGHSAAVYWHSLMFVSICASAETIDRVRDINREYERCRPVVALS